MVYGLEAVVLANIAFRAPRVEHYNEEQAAAVRTEDVDTAEQERLITCISTAKYLEGLRRYYNRDIKALQGFDSYSTTCFRNTTHLVAILGSMATNIIIGSDMWD